MNKLRGFYVVLVALVIAGSIYFVMSQRPKDAPPASVPAHNESVSRTSERPFRAFTNTIQAENYDIGGPDVAFHSKQSATEVGADYRPDHIHLIRVTPEKGGGYALGELEKGDWFNYTVVVGTDGRYILRARVSNDEEGAIYTLNVDGSLVNAKIEIPNTHSRSEKYTVAKSEPFELTAGQHVFKLQLSSTGKGGHGGTIDWLQGLKVENPQFEQSAR